MAKVEFFANGGKIGEADSAPFNLAWSTAAGTYALTVAATDGLGAVTQSSPVTVNVVASSVAVLGGLASSAVFSPNPFNLLSPAQFVNAVIEVSSGASAADIDPASFAVTAVNGVRLSSAVVALSQPPAQSGDANGNGIADWQVKFDSGALLAVLPLQEEAKLTVSVRFLDGTRFSVDGFIRTVKPVKALVGQSTTVVQPAGGANVLLPAGALSQDTQVTILKVTAEPPSDAAQRDAAAALKQFQRQGNGYDLGPEGTLFAVPVTLTFPYDASSLGGASPKALQIAYWNAGSGAWETLDSTVDTALRTVSARTTHFSVYQLLIPQLAPNAGTALGLGLVDVYAFPSPARGSQNPTIRAQVGLADSVDVHIYDISGRLVQSGSAAGPTLLDDGNGKGPQYTFDYTWNTAGVGSGVYQYAVTAKKAGSTPIHVTKKVGIIK